MKVNKKYLRYYFPGDYKEMKPAPEEVHYENNGRVYTQFFKGDLLPVAVWDEIFGSSKGVKPESVSVSTTISHSQIPQEVEEIQNENVEETSETVIENVEEKKEVKKAKPRKKRAKSIIKKS